jgi:hypothetical protein
MLDYAAMRQAADNRISWRKADALALPFEDAAFDLVCCQFGVMFFPDRQSGYREAKRVLKPGGHFLFNVWDRIEENVFANDVTNALAEVFPSDPPRFLARTPHGYHDAALIHSELEKAGFSSVVIETRADQSRASSPRHPAVAYCQGTPLRNEIEARDADKLEAATNYAASKIANRHGSGEVAAKIQAHVIVAAATARIGLRKSLIGRYAIEVAACFVFLRKIVARHFETLATRSALLRRVGASAMWSPSGEGQTRFGH